MASLSDGFKAKCEKKLNDAAAGKFFTANNARLLPSFDRSDEEKDTDDSDGKFAYLVFWSILMMFDINI